MNKRKLIALVTSLSLVAVVGIGATLAYFTDNASAQNVVTMGHVDISLTENEVTKDENGDYIVDDTKPVTEEGLEFEGVLPGDTIPKNPTINLLEGSVDAYVRIKMDITAAAESTITQADLDVLETNLRAQILEDANWYYNAADGYYYYTPVLSAEESAVLFETVTIPGEEWKNNTADQSFTIALQAEAIQADNFIPDMTGTQVSGWKGITAETYNAGE